MPTVMIVIGLVVGALVTAGIMWFYFKPKTEQLVADTEQALADIEAVYIAAAEGQGFL